MWITIAPFVTHDPDFPEQYQRLLERLDYQTMPGTKASGQRNSGYSGF
ncbi:hypothetical protein [Escherichia coli]|nr:hypothetical protein [Escherichia coli]